MANPTPRTEAIQFLVREAEKRRLRRYFLRDRKAPRPGDNERVISLVRVRNGQVVAREHYRPCASDLSCL